MAYYRYSGEVVDIHLKLEKSSPIGGLFLFNGFEKKRVLHILRNNFPIIIILIVIVISGF